MLMIEIFFLPKMHDRYLYIADVLSVVYYVLKRKDIFVPIAINIVSLYSYLYYLFDFRVIDQRVIAVLYFIAIVYFAISVYYSIVKKDDGFIQNKIIGIGKKIRLQFSK